MDSTPFLQGVLDDTKRQLPGIQDFGLSYIDNSLSWRLPIGLQIIFAVLLVSGVHSLPESPRFLLSTGQSEEGQLVVAALMNQPVDSEVTQQEKRVIVEALKGDNPRIRDVLTGGPSQHLRRTIIGASTQFFQQIGGCNAVIYFAWVAERRRFPNTLIEGYTLPQTGNLPNVHRPRPKALVDPRRS